MRILPALVALSVAGSALAQDATDDWDPFANPQSRVTMASVDFGNIGVIVRCQDGGLDAVLTGLPAMEAERREILLKFAEDEADYPTQWTVGVDRTMAVSESPSRFARNLRQGGRLDVVVPGGGPEGSNLRYALDLPSQHAVLDQTLTACGKPLEDPRDAELAALDDTGLPGGLGWARPPRPEYPGRIRTYERGFAVVSCLSEPDGGLRACEVDTEHPRDGGFGAATLTATRRARLSNTAEPGQPIAARMIRFRASFNMESVSDSHLRGTGGERGAPRN
jgi:hypothetical protein